MKQAAFMLVLLLSAGCAASRGATSEGHLVAASEYLPAASCQSSTQTKTYGDVSHRYQIAGADGRLYVFDMEGNATFVLKTRADGSGEWTKIATVPGQQTIAQTAR